MLGIAAPAGYLAVCIAHKSLRIGERCRRLSLTLTGLGDIRTRMGNLKYFADIE
jgi:hypothetical protein